MRCSRGGKNGVGDGDVQWDEGIDGEKLPIQHFGRPSGQNPRSNPYPFKLWLRLVLLDPVTPSLSSLTFGIFITYQQEDKYQIYSIARILQEIDG